MDQEIPDPRTQQLLMGALASFSACTLPLLTPGCPFYREEPFAVCGEECRSVLTAAGYSREVRTIQIEGLRLTGRAVPVAAVGPVSVWDPVKSLLEERGRALREQSTSTVLLRLWLAIMRDDHNASSSERLDEPMALAAELDRRGIPTDRVIHAELVPQLANQLSVRALVAHIEPELVEFDPPAGRWLALAETCLDNNPQTTRQIHASHTPESLRNLRRGWGYTSLMERLAPPLLVDDDIPDSDVGDEVADTGERITSALMHDPVMQFVTSPLFHHRVQHWLGARFGQGLRTLLAHELPASPVFDALATTPSAMDAVGTWIWDRYTMVNLDEWETESLLCEWGHRRGSHRDLDARLLRERIVDEEKLNSLIIERLTMATEKAPPSPTLRPDDFVDSAVQSLNAGDPARAAAIFESLADLDPTDGTVLSNMGFCLIPYDPARALEVFQRAKRLKLDQFALCSLNIAVAELMLGRAQNAAATLAGIADEVLQGLGTAHMWRVGTEDNGDLTLTLALEDDLREYAAQLRDVCLASG